MTLMAKLPLFSDTLHCHVLHTGTFKNTKRYSPLDIN